MDYLWFHNEVTYVYFFNFFLTKTTFKNRLNVVPEVSAMLDQACNMAFTAICKVLDRHSADGIPIFHLMMDEHLILRKHRRHYNVQVKGPHPKGLQREEWEDYNHWLLAKHYWKGILAALQPGHSLPIPDYIDLPLALSLAEETRLLLAMKEEIAMVGIPILGREGDCISLRPYQSFHKFTQRLRHQRGAIA
jgi:hypothetical protein